MPSNTPPIYCPHSSHTSLSYTSKGIRTSSQHRPNALRSFPSPSNSSLLVPHSSLEYPPNRVPLPILRPKMRSDLPDFLYIIRCNRTKPLLRKGKFSAEKATKGVFFPFQALVCRRPHFCKSKLFICKSKLQVLMQV